MEFQKNYFCRHLDTSNLNQKQRNLLSKPIHQVDAFLKQRTLLQDVRTKGHFQLQLKKRSLEDIFSNLHTQNKTTTMGRTLTKECLESTTSGVFVHQYALNPKQHRLIKRGLDTQFPGKNGKEPTGFENWARKNDIQFDPPKILLQDIRKATSNYNSKRDLQKTLFLTYIPKTKQQHWKEHSLTKDCLEANYVRHFCTQVHSKS